MNAPTDTRLAELVEALAGQALESGRLVVTAESCTGGWIAKACTDLPGSSRWFRGGVVVYANETKTGWIGVDAEVLARHGAVSEAVVRAMALGTIERLGGDLGVAVTGVAGPDGGTPEKPVGTVWLAWARRRPEADPEITVTREQFAGDRDTVRRATVERALLGLITALR
jgi:nicotinamide-nucleotide amidase